MCQRPSRITSSTSDQCLIIILNGHGSSQHCTSICHSFHRHSSLLSPLSLPVSLTLVSIMIKQLCLSHDHACVPLLQLCNGVTSRFHHMRGGLAQEILSTLPTRGGLLHRDVTPLARTQ
uniref:Uncharacterized protein n=1 Tax=Cacopsylla melanoneura TaxID=428564 RepID=A0A8D8MHL8_9HEMI